MLYFSVVITHLGDYFMRVFPIILFAMLMTSCATQTNMLTNSYDVEEVERGNDPFFIGGIGQTQTHNLENICKPGYEPAKTQTVLSPGNWLMAVITLGIYTPRQYSVYCTKKES
jgi:hypothetical protein